MAAAEAMTEKQNTFISDLFENQEKQRRETSKQNLITSISMLTTSMGNFFSNPQFVTKTAWLMLLMFGAYHGTKQFSGIVAMQIMARLGKPELIRETSRLYSRNILTLPFAWARKMALQQMR